MQNQICYLGYEINKFDWSPIPEKWDANLDTPTLRNVCEFKIFLDMLNFYYDFLNKLSIALEFLHKLLQKDYRDVAVLNMKCWKSK